MLNGKEELTEALEDIKCCYTDTEAVVQAVSDAAFNIWTFICTDSMQTHMHTLT